MVLVVAVERLRRLSMRLHGRHGKHFIAAMLQHLEQY
jgi:hypothetical protein